MQRHKLKILLVDAPHAGARIEMSGGYKCSPSLNDAPHAGAVSYTHLDVYKRQACAIGDRIPTVLRPEQQSYFALGYYQMGTRIEKDRRARIAAAAEKKAD